MHSYKYEGAEVGVLGGGIHHRLRLHVTTWLNTAAGRGVYLLGTFCSAGSALRGGVFPPQGDPAGMVCVLACGMATGILESRPGLRIRDGLAPLGCRSHCEYAAHALFVMLARTLRARRCTGCNQTSSNLCLFAVGPRHVAGYGPSAVLLPFYTLPYHTQQTKHVARVACVH